MHSRPIDADTDPWLVVRAIALLLGVVLVVVLAANPYFFDDPVSKALALWSSMTFVEVVIGSAWMARRPSNVRRSRWLNLSAMLSQGMVFALPICAIALAGCFSMPPARSIGFKVYYGDGTRLDMLHAAGAASARVVIVCVDGAEAGTGIVELLKAEFAHAPVLARARDRQHSLALIQAGADLQVREPFESALALGRQVLRTLGASEGEVADITEHFRKRDQERLQLEIVGGIAAGSALFSGRAAEVERVAPPRE